MKRKNFILHLIGEISSYLLEENPMRLVISLHQEKDLNRPKRPELASYYGAMTGQDLLGSSRLDLLGWQLKHADVSHTSSGIKIDLWLGGDKFDSERFNIPEKQI
jgi:hypothetical protein